MSQRLKRRIARAVLPVAVVLGGASATVLTWGLGVLLAVLGFCWAFYVLTDLRPDELRGVRR